MRTFETGLEHRTLTGPDGMYSGTMWLLTATPHQTFAGSGGTAYLNTSINVTTQVFLTTPSEGYLGLAFYATANDTQIRWQKGGTVLGSVRHIAASGRLQIYTGTSTYRAESAPGLVPLGASWRWISAHIIIDDAVGEVTVRLGEQDIGLTYSGDTKPGADTTIDCLGFDNGSNQGYMDDIVFNDTYLVLCYDGGVGGNPTIGATVTGTASGDTGVIEAYVGDEVSGFLIISGAVAADFTDNEQITDTGTFDALAQGDARDGNTDWPTEQYIVLRAASGAGASTAWTPSAGANYECIDELPPATYPDTANYISTTAAGNVDTYAWNDLPADVDNVCNVQMFAYCRRDGAGLTTLRLQARSGGTTYDVAGIAPPATWGWMSAAIPVNPNTGTAWTLANFNSAEFGVKSAA